MRVIALFNTRAEAAAAVDALQDQGIPAGEISVLMRDEVGTAADAREPHEGTLSEELEGLPLPVRALVLQDLGPIIAAGPWVSGLPEEPEASVYTKLTDMGFSQEQAEALRDRIDSGMVVVATRAGDDEVVRTVMDHYGHLLQPR